MLRFLLIVIFISSVQLTTAQVNPSSKADIEKAIADNNLTVAQSLTDKAIRTYTNERNADSLVEYIFYAAKIAQLQTNAADGSKKAEALLKQIKSFSPKPSTLRQAYIEAGEYYGFAGKDKQAYEANQQAQVYNNMAGKNVPQQGLIESNLGAYAKRMGDMGLSQAHNRKALQLFLSEPQPDFERVYSVYNSMGSSMWFSSKLDSAAYFFNKAIQALEKATPTIDNKYYNVAVLQNNLAGLYGQQGKTKEAIDAMKQCINKLRIFLASKEPSKKKNAALTFQFEATDNLAGIYKDLGDFKQALELLSYSYQQKKKNLDADNPGISISQILLGQMYYALKEFDKAKPLLEQGLAGMAKRGNLLWQGDACNTLALMNDIQLNETRAQEYYEQADQLYEGALQGEYDFIYLEFLTNAALFYAENKMLDKALVKANKGYQYTIKTDGAESITGIYQLLNFAEIYFVSGNYRQSLDYSNKGLELVNKFIRNSSNFLDSLKTELKKPKVLLLKCKSEYELLPQKNVATLNSLLAQLNEAMQILEKRKSVLSDPKDISLLMSDHNDLLEFVKKVTLDLYHITGQASYADQLLNLHESGIYSRIRARLDKSEGMKFAHLPVSLQQREAALKSALATALTKEGTHDQKMHAYLQATENWNAFLEKLRKEQPRYYKMRYASIFGNVAGIQQQIPEEVTVVRYFFAGKSLLALIADKQKKQWIELDSANLVRLVVTLNSAPADAVKTGDILYSLHQQLWAPLSKYIQTKKLVIIPDGILYHLNFELLTPKKVNDYAALSSNSLLAKHAISYQYSLFLLGQQHGEAALDKNFVAFAPGFSDQVKNDYLAARGDSLEVDNAYLSLLPQPFATSLASKAQKLLGGNAFMFDQSTVPSFKINAGNHKIIHIGTHAESDNLHPEYSRLIFAKNPSANTDSNSLYLFDIYNCDLSSNLTVLTACESGKPGYADGEGMISLAHAFNYAGSESIITGLWKIDEQASARLMDLFYQNLLQGLQKDEALQQAKLTYLSEANGRMLSPQYWAGLVLMGDTTPVAIHTAVNYTSILLGISALILAIILFVLLRRRK